MNKKKTADNYDTVTKATDSFIGLLAFGAHSETFGPFSVPFDVSCTRLGRMHGGHVGVQKYYKMSTIEQFSFE